MEKYSGSFVIKATAVKSDIILIFESAAPYSIDRVGKVLLDDGKFRQDIMN